MTLLMTLPQHEGKEGEVNAIAKIELSFVFAIHPRNYCMMIFILFTVATHTNR